MTDFLRAALAALMFISSFAALADAPKPFTQDEACAIVDNLQKVVSPRGIDVREEVTLGGILQWAALRHERGAVNR